MALLILILSLAVLGGWGLAEVNPKEPTSEQKAENTADNTIGVKAEVKEAEEVTDDEALVGKCQGVECSLPPRDATCDTTTDETEPGAPHIMSPLLGDLAQCCPFWACTRPDGSFFTHYGMSSVSPNESAQTSGNGNDLAQTAQAPQPFGPGLIPSSYIGGNYRQFRTGYGNRSPTQYQIQSQTNSRPLLQQDQQQESHVQQPRYVANPYVYQQRQQQQQVVPLLSFQPIFGQQQQPQQQQQQYGFPPFTMLRDRRGVVPGQAFQPAPGAGVPGRTMYGGFNSQQQFRQMF